MTMTGRTGGTWLSGNASLTNPPSVSHIRNNDMTKDIITHETNLLYLMARSADTMLADIESRLKVTNRAMRGDSKRRFKQFTGLIEQAGAHFRNFIEPLIIDCVDGDWKQYELSRVCANEMDRLLMLYYEVCFDNVEAHRQVFDLLYKLGEEKRLGVFGAEDINRFDLGCK